MNPFSSFHTRLRVMLEKVVRRNTVSLVSVVISFSMNWLWREESEEKGKKRGRRGEEEGKKSLVMNAVVQGLSW